MVVTIVIRLVRRMTGSSGWGCMPCLIGERTDAAGSPHYHSSCPHSKPHTAADPSVTPHDPRPQLCTCRPQLTSFQGVFPVSRPARSSAGATLTVRLAPRPSRPERVATRQPVDQRCSCHSRDQTANNPSSRVAAYDRHQEGLPVHGLASIATSIGSCPAREAPWPRLRHRGARPRGREASPAPAGSRTGG
jgi:hypothetical protein